MEKKPTNLDLKIRFFGIVPEKTGNEYMFKLVTLEKSTDDSLEIVEEIGPYYMIELEGHLKVAIGREKHRIFKGLVK